MGGVLSDDGGMVIKSKYGVSIKGASYLSENSPFGGYKRSGMGSNDFVRGLEGKLLGEINRLGDKCFIMFTKYGYEKEVFVVKLGKKLKN